MCEYLQYECYIYVECGLMTKQSFCSTNYIKSSFCEKQHQPRQWRAVFVHVWSPFFSHLLLGRQKDEYLCSILEVVPSFVILCHLLQPVVHLLLRLAVAAAAVVVFIVVVLVVPPPPPPVLQILFLLLILLLDC